jgi:cell division protein ZapA
MSQVSVTIAGRTYRIACAAGEEPHLEGLAALYDGKIEDMRSAFGDIGDMRLHVMAAITIADELAEARRQVEALEERIRQTESTMPAGGEHAPDLDSRVAEGLARAAERIERVARSLNPAPQGQVNS